MIKVSEFLGKCTIITSDNLIKKPKISVIMPTYCRGNNGLLKRAIHSVLAQSFKDFELIIVDDGSVDDTHMVVRHFLKLDNRIVYMRNEVNSGLPAIRANQGIIYARADYIAYQFDDDQWTVDGLEALYNEIISKGHPCVVYGKTEIIKTKENFNSMLGDSEVAYERLLEYNLIANNSVIHPKSLCYEYGSYDCSILARRVCDWELWLKWIKHVPFYKLDKLIAIVESQHDGSLEMTLPYDDKMIRNTFSFRMENSSGLSDFEEKIVDEIEFISDLEERDRVYRTHILPWLIKRRNIVKGKIKYELDRTVKNILVIKNRFGGNIKKCFSRYVDQLDGKYQMTVSSISRLNYRQLKDFQVIVLFDVRTPLQQIFWEMCEAYGITVIYAGLNINNPPDWVYKADTILAYSDTAIERLKGKHPYILPMRICKMNLDKDDDVLAFDSAISASFIHKYVGKQGAICYISHSGLLGGAEHLLLRHAYIARKYGLRAVLCMPTRFEHRHEIIERLCEQNGIKVIFGDYHCYCEPQYVQRKDTEYYSKFFIELATKENIRIYHSCTLVSAAYMAAKDLQIPYISSLYHVDASLKDIYPIIGNRDIWTKLIHSDSVLYANKWAALADGTGVCMRSPVQKEYFNESYVLKTNKKYINIVLLAALHWRKGQARAIEAVALLKERGVIVDLKLLGYDHSFPDYKKECEALIEKYKLHSQVKITGFCNDIMTFMRQADALLCASDSESLPQSVIEAMAQGIPVISTPVDAVPEMLTDGYNGYLSEGYDPKHIAEAIERFYNDFFNKPQKVIEISEASKQLAVEECREEVSAPRLFKLYKRGIDMSVV
jgi:glycosyltransferase involved in cell wall biosynthesis